MQTVLEPLAAHDLVHDHKSEWIGGSLPGQASASSLSWRRTKSMRWKTVIHAIAARR
jgi:hypothetical protein